jgi:alpha-glucosidase
MTDGTAREFLVDMSFLPEGEFETEIFKDGTNAQRYGSDYKKESIHTSNQDKLKIRLAPGGGWVARIYPTEKE